MKADLGERVAAQAALLPRDYAGWDATARVLQAAREYVAAWKQPHTLDSTRLCIARRRIADAAAQTNLFEAA